MPNSAFAQTYRSVRLNGILSQSAMQNRHIGYAPSNDGVVQRGDVDVTRVPQSSNQEQALAHAMYAVSAPHNGAFSVALERAGHGPLDMETRQQTADEIEGALSEQQRGQLQELMEYMNMSRDQALSLVAQSNSAPELTATGRQQASQRMENTFMVTAWADTPSTQATPHETTRSGIAPSQFTSVMVPEQHAHEADAVDQILSAQGHLAGPRMQSVPSVMGIEPHFQRTNGDIHSVTGVPAPDYHTGIAHQALQGAVDVHLVKTEFPRPHDE
ncbi:hypothetical protein [Trinickia fusca]|uniref:Uncharacterized protein n=1 Tax=Trinickia fusca TaxID=2419777 RepID=A0A494XH39_9BURK|nr:hypothetical protein [Trinickia fusca]RKP46863.1 hypothetical protein D7S89_16020 [Trinickia fusca]